jgi:1-acyl-sn-glycerol-3-phosphate acyltransferase
VTQPTFTFLGRRFVVPDQASVMVESALSLWAWSMLAAVSIGGFFIDAPLTALTYPFDRRRAISGRFVRDLGVLISKLNPMWDFQVHGELPDYLPSKTVVVGNHVSNSDVFLLAHLPWEMKWLAKESLFFVPFVGWLIWLAGDVPVRRGTRGSVEQAMETLKKHLERGMPVFIFPEGTRSASGDLLPFKDGAFRLAIETGADVLPVAVAGTRNALPKHSWRFGFARGRVTVGEPIATTGMSLADLDQLKGRVRSEIERLYARVAPEASGE